MDGCLPFVLKIKHILLGNFLEHGRFWVWWEGGVISIGVNKISLL
jgi:hypothetical protein